MIVIALETADANVRGLIARWLLELKPGVFVGQTSAKVRNFIWGEIRKNQDKFNGALMVYSSNNEMGFEFEMIGTPRRSIVDYDGLSLVKVMKKQEVERINIPDAVFESENVEISTLY